MIPGSQNTLTIFANVLEKVIAPTIAKGYLNETPMLMEVSKNSSKDVSFFNNQVFLPISNSPAFTYGTDPLNVMNTGVLNYGQFSVAVAPQYLSMRVPDISVASTQDRKGAIVSAVSEIYLRTKDGFRRSMNRMLLGSAGTSGTPAGTVALTTASTSGTSMVVNLDPDRQASQYLQAGQSIAIAGATGGSIGTNGTMIVSMTNGATSSTLTLKDNMIWTSASAVTFIGSDGGATLDAQGVGTLAVNSGTVQGVAVNTLSAGAHLLNGSAGAFSGSKLISLIESVQQGRITHLFANVSLYNEAAQSVIGLERTGMADQAYLDIGYSNFSAMGGTVKFVKDFDMPYGTIYGFDKSIYVLAELQPFGLFNIGSPLRVPGYTSYEFAFRWAGNFMARLIEPQISYYNLV